MAESEDHPNDKALAATVKLQAILDRIYQSPWHSKSDSHDISPPVVLVVNSIEEQLKQFQNDILPELEDNSQSNKSNQCVQFINHADKISD
jgi:hypothetical protein